METTITATELKKYLSDVLDRVKNKGERFLIESDGKSIATIVPVRAALGTTWEEFTARVRNLELPGEGFADDLEAVQSAQLPAKEPE